MYQRMSAWRYTCPLQGLYALQPGTLVTVAKVSMNKLVPLVEEVQVGKITLGVQYDTGCQLSIISRSALSILPPSMYSTWDLLTDKGDDLCRVGEDYPHHCGQIKTTWDNLDPLHHQRGPQQRIWFLIPSPQQVEVTGGILDLATLWTGLYITGWRQ